MKPSIQLIIFNKKILAPTYEKKNSLKPVQKSGRSFILVIIVRLYFSTLPAGRYV